MTRPCSSSGTFSGGDRRDLLVCEFGCLRETNGFANIAALGSKPQQQPTRVMCLAPP